MELDKLDGDDFCVAIHELAKKKRVNVNSVLAGIIKESACIHIQEGIVFEEYKKLMNDYIDCMEDLWPIG